MMYFSTLAATVAFFSAANALPTQPPAPTDYAGAEYYAPPTNTQPAYAAITHKVKVGGLAGNVVGGMPVLLYDPEFVFGRKGDVVEFDFLANNHTVTESTFESPCTAKNGGFKSGFRPNMANVPGRELFQVAIEDSMPRWVYCGQKLPNPHCQAGMVFAINPPMHGEKAFGAFKRAAIAAPISPAAPGDDTPNGAMPTTPKKDADTTAAPPTSTYTPPPPPPARTHNVTLGGRASDGSPILKYYPETVIANVGDIIHFDFLFANHTVTQSSFSTPCSAIAGGFKSGVRMNPENVPGSQTFDVKVLDTNPVWVYCGVGNHCVKGMVFAVNPGNKFKSFKDMAMKGGSAA